MQLESPKPVSFGQLAAIIFRAGELIAALQFRTSTSMALGNLFVRIHSSFFQVTAADIVKDLPKQTNFLKCGRFSFCMGLQRFLYGFV